MHPLLRKLLSCMQCGGIIKTNVDIDGCLVAYGCRVKRVQNWERSHIVSFYSRLFEEFGASRELRYLLKVRESRKPQGRDLPHKKSLHPETEF